MQQKHSTPHVISLLLIFAFSVGALFSVGSLIGKTNQAIALTSAPVVTNPAGLYSLTMGLGGGRCVFITFSGTYPNGTPQSGSSYTGNWNGSGDCVRAIAANNNTLSDFSINPTNTGLLGSGRTATEYLGSDFGILMLQTKLVAEDILKAEQVTGEYSPETFAGIKAFQKKNKLEETGYLDTKTIDLLNQVVIPTATYNSRSINTFEVKRDIIKETTPAIFPHGAPKSTIEVIQPAVVPQVSPVTPSRTQKQ